MTSMVANGMMDNDNYRYMKPVSEMSDVFEPRMRRGIDRASDRKGNTPCTAKPKDLRKALGRFAERTDLTAGQVYKCAIVPAHGDKWNSYARFLSSSAVSSRAVPAPFQRRFLLPLVRFMRYFSGPHIHSRTVIRLSDDLSLHHLLSFSS